MGGCINFLRNHNTTSILLCFFLLLTWPSFGRLSDIQSDDLDDGTGKMYEYRWGIRARLEMRKAEILKNVAKMYNVKPSDFKEQYDRVMDGNEADDLEEGVDNAGDAEEEQMD